MKKITKKSLSELAQVMPALSVQEQRMYIGGAESGRWYTLDQAMAMLDSGSWMGGVYY